MSVGSLVGTALAVLALAQATPEAKPPGAGQDHEPRKRRPVATDMASFEMLTQEQLAERTTIVAATRGLRPPPPTPLAPYLGRAFSERPTLRWRGRTPQVTVVVRDEAGSERLRSEVAGDRLAWPEALPLDRGVPYTWTVETPQGASDAAAFVILDGEERDTVAESLAGVSGNGLDAELERARLLAMHGIWYDCLGAYATLIERYPDRAELYRERAEVLAQVPRAAPAAEADRARATELGGTP